METSLVNLDRENQKLKNLIVTKDHENQNEREVNQSLSKTVTEL